MTTDDAEILAIAARASLSTYCYQECKAYCCRRGYLLLTATEVGLMQDTILDTLTLMPTPALGDEQKYIFNLGLRAGGCPNLLDCKCTIHTNPLRSKACKEFPLFIWKNKTIIVTDECPGVKENRLYSYLAAFKAMGYTLVYSGEKKQAVI